MAKHRKQYKNPPLIEVFTEFFFEPDPERGWDSFLLPNFYKKLKPKFPGRERLATVGIQVGIQLQLASSESPRFQPFGPPTPRHRFSSEDGKTLVQIGENLLVVNQLPPYYGWENYEPVVLDCYSQYSRYWKPARVARAALHYIDKIDIPRLDLDLEEYLNLFPVLPEFPGKPATNLTVSYEVEGASRGDIVVTTLRQQPSANPAGISFLLQWDYVATAGLPTDERIVASWVGGAHGFLSELFLSTLTDECRKLFD